MKVIFLHGNLGGTMSDGWFPWLKTNLEKLGLEVIAKDFPDPIEAKASIWLPFVEKLGADENTILIGWSSGAVAALRFAETHKIYGSVLVSSYYTDLGDATETISGYFNHPWDWEKIKTNQNFVIQFASTDDQFISIAEPRLIHEKLHSDYHEFTDQGHFGYPEEKKEFPELLAALKEKLGL